VNRTVYLGKCAASLPADTTSLWAEICLRCSQYLRLQSVVTWSDWRKAKWEGSSRGLVKALYLDLAGVTEESHESRSQDSGAAVNTSADNSRPVTRCCRLLT
jgi:hypothetical protein